MSKRRLKSGGSAKPEREILCRSHSLGIHVLLILITIQTLYIAFIFGTFFFNFKFSFVGVRVLLF